MNIILSTDLKCCDKPHLDDLATRLTSKVHQILQMKRKCAYASFNGLPCLPSSGRAVIVVETVRASTSL